jgi:hypothetical protein
MDRLKGIAALTAIVLAGPASAEEAAPAVLPGWMAGCWEERIGERWTEECWTAPRGGMMLGSGRSGTGDTVREWEAMQIIAADPHAKGAKLAFWAAPGGTGRTLFTWDPSDQAGFTFVNVGHDYPQRIRFWREQENFLAEISLADGSNSMRWRFKRSGK